MFLILCKCHVLFLCILIPSLFAALNHHPAQTITGKEVEIDIEPTDKIERVKERVEEKEGIPPPQQRLIFGGRALADDKTVKDYNIEGGSVIHLVLALRGGY
eukprot:TRINITY_DN11412_c0_g1_i5.p1 TRINITY_DN11412_c0_g1~~TRINITY_DN11412_c0_g1_i5.p1  ORF type:complete len:102 (+),score=16.49 TRINITY_DN11412_c0_g1_i5:232-537(+)